MDSGNGTGPRAPHAGPTVICAPFGVHGSEACSLAVRMGIPFGVSELFKRAGLCRVATYKDLYICYL